MNSLTFEKRKKKSSFSHSKMGEGKRVRGYHLNAVFSVFLCIISRFSFERRNSYKSLNKILYKKERQKHIHIRSISRSFFFFCRYAAENPSSKDQVRRMYETVYKSTFIMYSGRFFTHKNIRRRARNTNERYIFLLWWWRW